MQANEDKRFLYLYGGAGSGKSYSLAQYLLFEKMRKNKGVGLLCLRKTKPAIRVSCLPLIKQWLNKANIPYRENKSDLRIDLQNGNFIKFDSIDDIEKKKSIEGINYVWIEEATEFTKHEVMQLNLRCRAENPNGMNQLFFTFNPVDPIGNAWLKDLTDNANTHISKITGERDSAMEKVTHGDNKFLDEKERVQIEELANQDDEYNKIYRLGEWATPTNIIYENWDIVDGMPDSYDDLYWGLDFGFSSTPAALIQLAFKGKEVWLRQRLYRTGLTNPKLIERLNDIIENKNQHIIADSAEPKSIQEIRNDGFNILPCKKGADSVRFGIRSVKSFKMHVTKDSTDIVKELRGYKWKTEKDGEIVSPPEPLKVLDHSLDAIRYCISYVKGLTKAGLIVVDELKDEYDELKDEYDEESMWNDMS